MSDSSSSAEDRPAPGFAHASEAEMARILDFYDVRWAYEPHVFPIQWNLEGDVIESFAPDFWLPDVGLYLEMTTLKQRLVRRKNRKLRRVRELYPDIRVKLFYARDFRALMLKYGKLALAAELSGTLGHLPPVRARPVTEEPVATTGEPLAVVPAPAVEPAVALAAVALPATRPAAEGGAARRRRARRRSARQAAVGTQATAGGAQ